MVLVARVSSNSVASLVTATVTVALAIHCAKFCTFRSAAKFRWGGIQFRSSGIRPIGFRCSGIRPCEFRRGVWLARQTLNYFV
jgi:hypothetical protein